MTCPICREDHKPRSLSYDGKGVNSCGAYRTRIATIPDEYAHLGPVFAAAPELLAALKRMVYRFKVETPTGYSDPGGDVTAALVAIAKADGRS